MLFTRRQSCREAHSSLIPCSKSVGCPDSAQTGGLIALGAWSGWCPLTKSCKQEGRSKKEPSEASRHPGGDQKGLFISASSSSRALLWETAIIQIASLAGEGNSWAGRETFESQHCGCKGVTLGLSPSYVGPHLKGV